MTSNFPACFAAAALLDRGWDALGDEEPPRDDVPVPRVDDYFNALVEKISVHDLEGGIRRVL